jgi:hypothetical protein
LRKRKEYHGIQCANALAKWIVEYRRKFGQWTVRKMGGKGRGHPQIKEFVEQVFLPDNPNNDVLYTLKTTTTEEIFNIVNKHSTLVDRSLVSFTKWCSTQRVSFLLANDERKLNIRSRRLFVLKEEYLSKLKYQ